MKTCTLAGVALVLGLHASLATAHERCGDARPYDGVVDIGDAVFVLRLSVGLEAPTAEDLGYLDIAPMGASDETTVPPTITPAPNGVIDIGDAVLVLRHAVGLVAIVRCEPAARRIPTLLAIQPDRACSGGLVRVAISDPDALGFGTLRLDGARADVVHEDAWATGVTRWLRVPALEPMPPAGVSLVVTLDGALGEKTLTALPPCDEEPRLDAISPVSGHPQGATLVHLWGSGLQCASDVAFVGTVTGQREMASVVYAPSDEEIIVLPWRAGSDVPQSFDVVVTTPCGSATLPEAFRFD